MAVRVLVGEARSLSGGGSSGEALVLRAAIEQFVTSEEAWILCHGRLAIGAAALRAELLARALHRLPPADARGAAAAAIEAAMDEAPLEDMLAAFTADVDEDCGRAVRPNAGGATSRGGGSASPPPPNSPRSGPPPPPLPVGSPKPPRLAAPRPGKQNADAADADGDAAADGAPPPPSPAAFAPSASSVGCTDLDGAGEAALRPPARAVMEPHPTWLANGGAHGAAARGGGGGGGGGTMPSAVGGAPPTLADSLSALIQELPIDQASELGQILARAPGLGDAVLGKIAQAGVADAKAAAAKVTPA